MKKKYIFSVLAPMLFGLPVWTGCADDNMVDGGTVTDGLVLDLRIDGSPAMSAVTRSPSDASLRENVVETVDVCFISQDGTLNWFPTAEVDANGKARLAGSEWKEKYTGVYDVYVLANVHSYDNPLTTEPETDFSWVTTKNALLALVDTDLDVFRVEREDYGTAGEYTGKTFFMDGKISAWNAAEAAAVSSNAELPVELVRAAAKIEVNVTYTDGFLKDGITLGQNKISKKLVRYARDARMVAEAGDLGTAVLDLYGVANSDDMSAANYTEGEELTREDLLLTYSYPNFWGSDVADRETYVLMNIPYNSGEDFQPNNYYKVPLRQSSSTDDLRLERNKHYVVNVTVDRLGNESVDTPEELKPEIIIQDWKEQEIPVDDSTPNYLMLSDDYIEMNNVADTTITFFSSSAITVEVKEVYFLDKNGNKDENYTIPAENWRDEDINIELKPLVKANWDSGKLQGSIKISSEIPTNVTARYITLEVTNTDGLKKTISIVQYPLEYISGVPGVYATRSDFEITGNTYENYANGTRVSSNVKLNTGGDNPTFRSKVYDNGTYYVTKNNNKLSHGGSSASSLSNNRMYLVQITSTSGGHTVARPAMEGTGEDIVTKSDGENNRLVSPMFMLASQLGAVQTANWSTAQEHCKQYVEVAKYEDGTTKRFADWRLPTFAELQVIAQYQNEQPEVMDEVLGGEYYWSAQRGYCIIRKKEWGSYTDDWESEPSTSRTTCYIRCIRDVSPEDLEEFRAHGVK